MEIVDSVYDHHQHRNERFNLDYDISELVIPFSIAFKSFKLKDIYSGNERIPFKEREPEYKMILRQEFAEFLR